LLEGLKKVVLPAAHLTLSPTEAGLTKASFPEPEGGGGEVLMLHLGMSQ
jgi:hypothetical protein